MKDLWSSRVLRVVAVVLVCALVGIALTVALLVGLSRLVPLGGGKSVGPPFIDNESCYISDVAVEAPDSASLGESFTLELRPIVDGPTPESSGSREPNLCPVMVDLSILGPIDVIFPQAHFEVDLSTTTLRIPVRTAEPGIAELAIAISSTERCSRPCRSAIVPEVYVHVERGSVVAARERMERLLDEVTVSIAQEDAIPPNTPTPVSVVITCPSCSRVHDGEVAMTLRSYTPEVLSIELEDLQSRFDAENRIVTDAIVTLPDHNDTEVGFSIEANELIGFRDAEASSYFSATVRATDEGRWSRFRSFLTDLDAIHIVIMSIGASVLVARRWLQKLVTRVGRWIRNRRSGGPPARPPAEDRTYL